MARPRPISFEENGWIRAADADHFALLEDWQDVTKVTLYHKETGWSVELPPLHRREPRLQIYTDSHVDAFIIHGAHGSRHCRDYFPHQICMKDGDDEQTPWLRVLKRTQQTFSHCTLTDYKNTFKSGSLASRSALLPNRSTFRTAASARPKGGFATYWHMQAIHKSLEISGGGIPTLHLHMWARTAASIGRFA